MNAGRIRAYQNSYANAMRGRAMAFRHAADAARGFGCSKEYIKCILGSMRFAALEMRSALKEGEARRTAA